MGFIYPMQIKIVGLAFGLELCCYFMLLAKFLASSCR
jgi:hypothetical protein